MAEETGDRSVERDRARLRHLVGSDSGHDRSRGQDLIPDPSLDLDRGRGPDPDQGPGLGPGLERDRDRPKLHAMIIRR
ncbi:hypothetical protein BGZ51_007878, partial [Haplosporangium sp. Z 767]